MKLRRKYRALKRTFLEEHVLHFCSKFKNKLTQTEAELNTKFMNKGYALFLALFWHILVGLHNLQNFLSDMMQLVSNWYFSHLVNFPLNLEQR